MSFKIHSIVIYGKNSKKRTLEFNTSGVTIISGDSETGKSSIADIISYCLGGDYTMKGKVKEVISWYGIKLLLPGDNEVFIARKAPGLGQKSTNACYFMSGGNIDIPEFGELDGQDSIESAISFLTKEMGVSKSLGTLNDPTTKSSPKPHLKHSLYYCFLKQSNIAHEKILFHRQDEAEVKKFISLTAQYFLGAIPEDTIVLLQKLSRLKGELKSVETSLKETESIIGEGATKGRKLVDEAKAFGLIASSSEAETLIEISKALKNAKIPKMSDIDSIPTDKILSLKNQREDLMSELSGLKEELSTVSKFVTEEGKYSFEVTEQLNRLQSIKLFSISQNHSKSCPTCGHEGISLEKVHSEVIRSMDKLKKQISHATNSRGSLNTLAEDLKKQSREVRGRISEIDKSVESVYEHNANARKAKDDQLEAAKILGRITLYLETVSFKDNAAELKNRQKILEKEIGLLEEKLDGDSRDELFKSYIAIIGKDMTEWAEQLQMEYAGCPHQISFSKLTVEALTETGSVDMQGMGSAKNWLGCHLIAYLGLQKWFIKKHRPVPQFVFMDQPSQVWFPTEDELKGNSKASKDMDKVKKLYSWIFEKSQAIPDLQIIMVDHVKFTDKQFVGALKEEWRDGKALVPKAWLKTTRRD